MAFERNLISFLVKPESANGLFTPDFFAARKCLDASSTSSLWEPTNTFLIFILEARFLSEV